LKEKKQKFKAGRLLPALPFAGKSKAKKLKFLLRFSLKMTFTAKRHRAQPSLTHRFRNAIFLSYNFAPSPKPFWDHKSNSKRIYEVERED
jgi:hypothetical protein